VPIDQMNLTFSLKVVMGVPEHDAALEGVLNPES
jgi:hypothetical protein